VRFGGNVTVAEDETVSQDVVVIGGNIHVHGEVRGEVVAVGGNVELGPKAVVGRDVVVVGGTLQRDPAARIGGDVQEIGVGTIDLSGLRLPRFDFGRTIWTPMFGSAFSLLATLVRVAVLFLLAAAVVLVGRDFIERVGACAVAQPLKSGAIGFLSQCCFLPVLIIAIVVLVITIVGIPLLLLLPFGILGLLLVALVGFTAVANRVGTFVGGRLDWGGRGPYLATFAGIVLIVSPILLARLLSLVGAGIFPVTFALRLTGTLLEYAAWTVGFGAVALAWFSRPDSRA
jgi:hypothetical protein